VVYYQEGQTEGTDVMNKLLLTTIMAFAVVALPAKADVILGGQNWTFAGADNLTLTPVVPGGNQPLNVQCVICGDNQPQQAADFGYTNFKNSGNLTDALFFSTNVSGGANPGLDTVGLGYDGSFLRAYLLANGATNLQFTIGIDVNDTNVPQVLESFYLLNLTTHTVLSVYSLLPGGTPLVNQNNGTGFPDWTLSGFNIQLGTDIHAGDQLIFFARLSNASDGPDSFFIQPAAVAVPGPIAGAGIPGALAALFMLGLAKYRRRRLAA
jgi:hypothetical protein